MQIVSSVRQVLRMDKAEGSIFSGKNLQCVIYDAYVGADSLWIEGGHVTCYERDLIA